MLLGGWVPLQIAACCPWIFKSWFLYSDKCLFLSCSWYERKEEKDCFIKKRHKAYIGHEENLAVLRRRLILRGHSAPMWGVLKACAK